MLILALDTTTRAGSLALVRDEAMLETFVGDAGQTHATRLPGDILDCLARHHLALADIDLYAVAAGPGSFTGLRIGIATVQGLAFAHGRPVAGISALDALAAATGAAAAPGELRAAWMDAQRGEVYAGLYRDEGQGWVEAASPVVQTPQAVLSAWEREGSRPAVFVGDGAVAYGGLIEEALGARTRIVQPVPALAPAVAALASRAAAAGLAGPPHAIRPVYIRRPDAELARERRAVRTP